jgi:hypothetical protein
VASPARPTHVLAAHYRPTQRSRFSLEPVFDTLFRVGTWHDPDLGRPIAAPLERCAELLGVDLATVCELAANIEPYVRADGGKCGASCGLSGSSAPRRMAGAGGGYVDRRQIPAAEA